MYIFPAIDLYEGKAVRLLRGNYSEMTIYDNDPVSVAKRFFDSGAEYLHVVDLEGARDGTTANFETIGRLIKESGLKVEIGGGVRTEEVVKRYLQAGALRVILGTAAVTQPELVEELVQKYGSGIAVGVDIKDGMAAIKGWTETSSLSCFDFFERLEKVGVKTVICTDISKDGVLSGTNTSLYKELSERFSVDIVASGGVSTLEDVNALSSMGLYGAILGKALYTGNIDLKAAIAAAKGASK